jgi:hypothetical protein
VLAALDIFTEGYVHARRVTGSTKTLAFLSADEALQELCHLIDEDRWTLVSCHACQGASQ